MEILVTTEQWFPDYAGGTARVARESAVALAAAGHRVTVVAPYLAGVATHVTEEGVDVRRTLRRFRGLPKTYTDVLALRHALRGIEPRRFDVVLAHHATSLVGAVGLRLPTAYMFHASPLREARHRRERGVGRVQALRSFAVESALAVLERKAAARADRIFVLSEYSGRLVAEDHPGAASKLVRVSGGVDTGVFRPAQDRAAVRSRLGVHPETLLLLTVRRLVNRMGVDILLEALQRVCAEVPAVRLVVIGKGEERAGLERLAEALGVRQRVHFAGRVSEEDLNSWYQAADLFVLPTVAYEGFGIATVEALASGTPVVGTAVGATPEILRTIDPEMISPDADSSCLADAITRLVRRLEPELRARCREQVETRYSWTKVIGAWEQGLHATVTAHAGQR